MSPKRGRKRRSYLGFLGFAGFIGFSYFHNHNVASLSYFAYFGFFAYFWIAKIANQMPDERYLENVARAKSTAFDIVIIELVALNLLSLFGFTTKEVLVALLALCFSSLLIIYAVKFYLLEEK
jgi:hypothetical protein